MIRRQRRANWEAMKHDVHSIRSAALIATRPPGSGREREQSLPEERGATVREQESSRRFRSWIRTRGRRGRSRDTGTRRDGMRRRRPHRGDGGGQRLPGSCAASICDVQLLYKRQSKGVKVIKFSPSVRLIYLTGCVRECVNSDFIADDDRNEFPRVRSVSRVDGASQSIYILYDIERERERERGRRWSFCVRKRTSIDVLFVERENGSPKIWTHKRFFLLSPRHSFSCDERKNLSSRCSFFSGIQSPSSLSFFLSMHNIMILQVLLSGSCFLSSSTFFSLSLSLHIDFLLAAREAADPDTRNKRTRLE